MSGDPRPKTVARDWLQRELLEHSGAPARILQRRWQARGGSRSTLRRAAAQLGVIVTGSSVNTFWRLPEVER